MKTARVWTTWKAYTEIEDVPDELDGTPLMDLPINYLDDVTSQTAELVDWEIEWVDA